MQASPAGVSVLLLCVCLFLVAPVAADTVMVSTLGELTDNITSTVGDRTIIVTKTIDAGNSYIIIKAGSNITLMPGETSGISINRTLAANLRGGMFLVNGGCLTLAANATTPGSTLTIDGGMQSGNIPSLVMISSGNFTLQAGTLTNNTVTDHGGGVFVGNSGTFTMTGGKISGNRATYGGGVYVGGTFTMSGGAISDNTVTRNGGGVFMGAGTFTMENGIISGNTADLGGGVFVYCGMFTMKNGEISDNTARTGGGVSMGGGAGTFTMEKGIISGNTVTEDGGGVFVYSGTFTMAGDAEIAGNNELYLESGMYITLSDPAFTGSAENISGNTTDVIKIGYSLIRMSEGLNAHDYWSSFVLRNTNYGLVPDTTSRNLTVAPAYHLSVINGDGSGRYTESAVVPIVATVPAGQIFDYWNANVTVTFANANEASTTVTMPAEDVEVTAHFKNSPVPPTPVPHPAGDGNMDNAFRVLFDTAGGSSISPVTGLSYGDIISAPSAPAREGYTFGGWYTDEGLTAEWNFADSITGDMTLYAKWTPLRVTPTATVTVSATVTATAAATATVTATPTSVADVTATVPPLQTPSSLVGVFAGLLLGLTLHRRNHP